MKLIQRLKWLQGKFNDNNDYYFATKANKYLPEIIHTLERQDKFLTHARNIIEDARTLRNEQKIDTYHEDAWLSALEDAWIEEQVDVEPK